MSFGKTWTLHDILKKGCGSLCSTHGACMTQSGSCKGHSSTRQPRPRRDLRPGLRPSLHPCPSSIRVGFSCKSPKQNLDPRVVSRPLSDVFWRNIWPLVCSIACMEVQQTARKSVHSGDGEQPCLTCKLVFMPCSETAW